MIQSRYNRTLTTALGVAVLFGACKSTSNETRGSTPNANAATAPHSLPFVQLHNHFLSGFASPSEFVIEDLDEFTRRWRGVVQGSPDAAMPTVDFEKTTVILVATGSRNTDGHAVRVDSVVSTSGNAPRQYTVFYTVTSPGARCMSLQSLSAPVAVVSLDRLQGAVRFKKRSVSGRC